MNRIVPPLLSLLAMAMMTGTVSAQGISPTQQIGTNPGNEDQPGLNPNASMTDPSGITGSSIDLIRRILIQQQMITEENDQFRRQMEGLKQQGAVTTGSGGTSPLGNAALRQVLDRTGVSLGSGGTLSGETRPGSGTTGNQADLYQQEILRQLDDIQRRMLEIMLQMQQEQQQQEGRQIQKMASGGLPPLITDAEMKLRKQAEERVESDTPAWLAAWSHVAQGNVSTQLPNTSSLPYNTAYYAGDVVGTAGNGAPLDGLFNLGFGQDGAEYVVNGSFEFGPDNIYFSGGVPDASDNLFTGGFDMGGLAGGSLSGPGAIEGAFYGPAQEQVGGAWQFGISGGSTPGTASGQFAGGQIETN